MGNCTKPAYDDDSAVQKYGAEAPEAAQEGPVDPTLDAAAPTPLPGGAVSGSMVYDASTGYTTGLDGGALFPSAAAYPTYVGGDPIVYGDGMPLVTGAAPIVTGDIPIVSGPIGDCLPCQATGVPTYAAPYPPIGNMAYMDHVRLDTNGDNVVDQKEELAGSGWHVSGPSVTMAVPVATPTHSAQKIIDRHQAMDLNGDNVVDANERAIAYSGAMPTAVASPLVPAATPMPIAGLSMASPAYAEQARLDTNMDTYVTQKEELAGHGWHVSGPSVAMQTPVANVGTHSAQRLVDRHVAMDTNNDGVVSYAERAAAYGGGAGSPPVVVN